MTTTTAETGTFADWLADYQNGRLDNLLTAALHEVAEKVSMLDKAGSIQLSLTIAPQGGGVIVTGKVSHKSPQAKEAGQFFFVDPAGGLSRRDPRQPTLPGVGD